MASQQKREEDQPTTSPSAAGFGGMVVERYGKIREHAETYPYVWASYIVVYGGLGLWATYRWRKLRKTEDRVRVLQERLRKLVETQEGFSSAKTIANMADPSEYETRAFPGGVVEMTASNALDTINPHFLVPILLVGCFGSTKLSILPNVGFIIFCWFVVRPFLSKKKYSSNKRSSKDFDVLFILAGVILCGLITDACGSSSMTGAFVLGIAIPDRGQGTRITEESNDFVAGIMLPALIDVVFTNSNQESNCVHKNGKSVRELLEWKR
ncbi:hypothetical protein SADUNF_Sadunf05G0041500 [Salix dunnii]|uniref:Cation/H+ exchanger transmembrane domain-containing protein n=1 Tax=Salix dunnii TaxID=1413687 RepID=A0A835K0P6_9ROSI|nr:hypothetical protein SADUNF_Sadunf05G0041500 [Salix dunnii]